MPGVAMRKKIILITFLIVLTASTAYAIIPAIYWTTLGYIGAWSAANPRMVECMADSIMVHAAAISLAYAWNDEQKKKATVTPDGKIKKPMEVIVIPPPTEDHQLPIKKGAVKAKVEIDDLRNEVLKDAASKAKYPNLKNALEGLPEGKASANPAAPSPVGSYVKTDSGVWYQITSVCTACGYSTNSCQHPGQALVGGKFVVTEANGQTGCPAGWTNSKSLSYNVVAVPNNQPPLVAKTNPEVAKKLANSPTNLTLPADVYSDVYGQEIDDFIKDNPNVVHYEDDAGNAANAAEIAHATQAEIDRAQQFQKQQEAVTAAENAATSARGRATSARAAADANPGDSGLAAAAAAAEAAADAAEAAAARARAEYEQYKEQQQKEDEELEVPTIPDSGGYDSNITPPDKKSIPELLTEWGEQSPLAGMVRSFTIETSSPVTSVSCGTYFGQEIKFDFSRYENIFTVCGGVFLVIAHGFCVLIVIRGW